MSVSEMFVSEMSYIPLNDVYTQCFPPVILFYSCHVALFLQTRLPTGDKVAFNGLLFSNTYVSIINNKTLCLL